MNRGFYMKKNVALTLNNSDVRKWEECFISSTAIWVTSSNTGSDASRWANLLNQNVNKLEFELSRIYTKQP